MFHIELLLSGGGHIRFDVKDHIFKNRLGCFFSLTNAVRNAHSCKCIAYYRKAWFDQAISDFDDAIARDVDCAEFYWWRGQAWEGKGEGEKAREDFQKAVALGYEEDEES